MSTLTGCSGPSPPSTLNPNPVSWFLLINTSSSLVLEAEKKQTAKLAVRHKYCGVNNNSVSHDHNQITNVKVELTFAVQHGFRLEVELRWVQFRGAGADGMWREGESLGRRLSRTGSFSTDGAGGNVLLLGNGNSWGELNEQMDKHYPSIHWRSSTSVNNTLKYYPKPWHF